MDRIEEPTCTLETSIMIAYKKKTLDQKPIDLNSTAIPGGRRYRSFNLVEPTVEREIAFIEEILEDFVELSFKIKPYKKIAQKRTNLQRKPQLCMMIPLPYVYLDLNRLNPNVMHSSVMRHAKFFMEESTVPKEPELNQGTNRTFCMNGEDTDGLWSEFHKMISKAEKEIFEGWNFTYSLKDEDP